MDPLASMLLAAVAAATTKILDGAQEQIGAELWQWLKPLARLSDSDTTGQAAFDQAVQRARRELIAADPTGAAATALALLADATPERRALLAAAVEELLFSAQPNHGRLRDIYQRQIGFLAFLRNSALPPWPAVEPHLAALLARVRAAAAGSAVLGPLSLAREQRAALDEARAARRAGEESAVTLQRIAALLDELLRQPRISASISATDGASISDARLSLIVGDYRSLPATVLPDLEQLYLHYRTFLVRRYGELGTHAITTPGDRAYVSLADVYLPLDAQRAPRPSRSGTAELYPAHTLVRDEPALALLGAAGSGKSTLVRRLMLALAQGQAEAVFQLDDNYIPILIPAVALVATNPASPLLSPIDLLQRSFQAQGAPDYTPLLRRALLAGRALVIFDGLDEVVTREGRVALRHTIERFAQVWDAPGNRLLVTSRAQGYTDVRLDERLFAHAILQPLDDRRIAHAARTWATALQLSAAPGMDDPPRRLLTMLAANAAAHELARTPLLLTLLLVICARGEALPTRRADLYLRTVQLLADDWGLERSFAESPQREIFVRTGDPIGASFVTAMLGAAALRARVAATDSAVGTPALRDQLAALLYDEYDVPRPSLMAAVDGFLDTVARGTGLLTLDTSGEIRLLHRSFLDYMAGHALAGTHAKQADDYVHRYGSLPAWRELLCFAVATAAPEVAASLVRGLLAALPGAAGRWEAMLTAGTCLVEREGLSFDNAVSDAVVAGLVTLLADQETGFQQRVEGGALLGRLGDPRLLDHRRGDAAAGGAQRQSFWCAVGPGSVACGDDRYETLRPVALDYAYAIARHPVSNAEFAPFIAANGAAGYAPGHPWWTEGGRALLPLLGRHAPRHWRDWRYANPSQPVVGVSWYEATAYCRWLTLVGQAQGWLDADHELRLPTWLEREHAARAPEGRRHPWGDTPPSLEHAHYLASGVGYPAPVGCFPAGAAACGALDLAGNVAEWTASLAAFPLAQAPITDAAPTADIIISDSSFCDPADSLGCGARAGAMPEIVSDNRGFRVVRAPIVRTPGPKGGNA